MTEEGKRIYDYWFVLVAVNVVLGKMSRKKAEREAYKEIVNTYGEDYLKQNICDGDNSDTF